MAEEFLATTSTFDTQHSPPSTSSMLKITNGFVTFSTLSLITSSILLSLVLGYLSSIELVRRGLLLYIYKDLITIFMCIQWIWCVLVVTCYFTGNGTTLDTTIAKIMSYGITFFLLQFLLSLNILSLFKLQMTKKMILDPQLPWEQEDSRDPRAVAKIRTTCILCGALIVVSMVAFEGYPKLYYNLIGDYESLAGWPIGSSIILVLYVVLISMYVITAFATEVYQKKNNSYLTESTLPQHLQIIPRMFLLIASMVSYCYVFYNMFGNGQLWFVTQLMLTVTGVLCPTFIISNSPPLKAYLQHTLEIVTNHLSHCKPRSHQIEPIV